MSLKSLKIFTCLAILLISVAQPLTHIEAGITKLPKTSSNTQLTQPVEALELPEDYPKEITQYFDENITARSFVVIDEETDRVLAEREGNTPYEIASMSKVASIYLVYKAIDEGKITMDTKVKIPQEIVDNISSNYELSNVGLTTEVEYPVRDLMYAMMLPSGNDATSALLWEIYGNEEVAVNAIMEQLNAWGITNAEYYQTSGVPNANLPETMWIPDSNSSSENKMSAVDMGVLAEHLIEEYPEVLKITSDLEYTFMEGTPQEQILSNFNSLLPGASLGREGVTGLKSGYTELAGKTMTTTTTENGRKLIVVVMGVYDSNISTYQETELILNKLNEYPDLYKNEKLPVVTKPSPEEIAAQKEKEAAEKAAKEKKENPDSEKDKKSKNKRDNAITNFIRSVFGIFG